MPASPRGWRIGEPVLRQRDYLKNGIGHLGYYLELPGSSEGQLLGAESGCAAYVDTYSLAKWVCLNWEYPYNVRCNSIIKGNTSKN